jgi:hypothetical protein
VCLCRSRTPRQHCLKYHDDRLLTQRKAAMFELKLISSLETIHQKLTRIDVFVGKAGETLVRSLTVGRLRKVTRQRHAGLRRSYASVPNFKLITFFNMICKKIEFNNVILR